MGILGWGRGSAEKAAAAWFAEVAKVAKGDGLPVEARMRLDGFLKSGVPIDGRSEALGGGEFDRPALMTAAGAGNEPLALFLLARGADPDASNDQDGSALCLALRKGAFKVAEALLARGADPNKPGGFGTPTALFAYFDHRQAVWSDDESMPKALVAAGCSCEAADGQGFLALHRACVRSSGSLISALLPLSGPGAVDARTENGWTPLSLALSYENLSATVALVDAGADLDLEARPGAGGILEFAKERCEPAYELLAARALARAEQGQIEEAVSSAPVRRNAPRSI